MALVPAQLRVTGLAATVALVLVAGTGGSTYFAIEATCNAGSIGGKGKGRREGRRSGKPAQKGDNGAGTRSQPAAAR